MMRSKVFHSAKEYFRKYFPDDGAAPKPSLGKKMDLVSGEYPLQGKIVMGNNALKCVFHFITHFSDCNELQVV